MLFEITICVLTTCGIIFFKKYISKKELDYIVYIGKGKYPNNIMYPLVKMKYKNYEDYSKQENKIYLLSKNPEKNKFLRNLDFTIITIKDEKSNEIFSSVLEKSHH
jgi:hypothetical protein